VTKKDLQELVVEALRSMGGSVRLIDVSRFVWEHHESELREAGDLLFVAVRPPLGRAQVEGGHACGRCVTIRCLGTWAQIR